MFRNRAADQDPESTCHKSPPPHEGLPTKVALSVVELHCTDNDHQEGSDAHDDKNETFQNFIGF